MKNVTNNTQPQMPKVQERLNTQHHITAMNIIVNKVNLFKKLKSF